MDIDLDFLKQEITEQLTADDFAVFRGHPAAGSETIPVVVWETDEFPDFHGFLNAARGCGVKLIIFSSRIFDAEWIDEAEESLEQATLTRDERRTVESGLRDLRAHAGETCSIELAFVHGGVLYLYEVATEWYENYRHYEGILDAAFGEDEDDESSPLGGFYSNN